MASDPGASAEEAARRHLEQHGLRTVACNHRTRRGEIDLIMRDGTTTVFVEVRHRRGDLESAVRSVDRGKRRRLIQAARHYLARHPGYARFDVVATDGCALRWLQDAFRADARP